MSCCCLRGTRLTPLEAPPKISPFEFSSQLKAGDKASAACLASGSPPLAFKWLKEGREVEGTGASITSTEDFSNIVIKHASSDHSGNYTCVVTNGFGSDSHTSRLRITCESASLVVTRTNTKVVNSSSRLGQASSGHTSGRRKRRESGVRSSRGTVAADRVATPVG